MLVWTGVGLLAFLFSTQINAPYGRHTAIPDIRKWGPSIPNKLAWFIMELPTLLIFTYLLITGTNTLSPVLLGIASLYLIHYLYRSIWFPLQMRTTGKTMPFVIALMAIGFNVVNASMLGYWFGSMAIYSSAWLTDPRFIFGLVIFFTGMYIHVRSDHMLINLRKPGETDYKVPTGFLFEKISCPNHFGEMLQWAGFALLSWSLPALVFALWTIFNVLPRSLAHHKWYQAKFSDYPKKRKAVWPGIL
jgi:3-oxo-5-alpha-steroid 4-dehydrogenase 1